MVKSWAVSSRVCWCSYGWSSRVCWWPLRFYCHLLGLGVVSILYSLFYSQVPGPKSQVPSPKSQVLSPSPSPSRLTKSVQFLLIFARNGDSKLLEISKHCGFGIWN